MGAAVLGALPQLAMAGLERGCFFVDEMYGPVENIGTELKSDLPILIAMYEPGMKLQTIVVSDLVDSNDSENEYFVGI